MSALDSLRRAAALLAWYWGVTLFVPYMNGAGGEPAFAEHAVTTLAAGAAAGILLGGRLRSGR